MWRNKGNERLAAWRNFRKSQASLSLSDQLNNVVNLWKNSDLGNNHYDYFNIDDWPSPWELILDDSYDDFGKALGMSWTLIMIDDNKLKNLKLSCYKDADRSSFYHIVHVEDKFMLNYQFDKVSNTSLLPETAVLLCEYNYIDLFNKTL
jgi:hypothetical protein